jgi:hypothetical protein
MVQMTLEIPEHLLGDVYIAVGRVLHSAQDDCCESPGQAGQPAGDDDDEPAGQA